jgi:hypothetical protein
MLPKAAQAASPIAGTRRRQFLEISAQKLPAAGPTFREWILAFAVEMLTMPG